MFVGRHRELAVLEEAYEADGFQMVVVYGRRRVGKTTLLTHFAQGKRTLFFTAQQQSDLGNLTDFCHAVAAFFGLPTGTVFSSWDAVLAYLADQAHEHPYLLIFDEFPYAATANRTLVSKLQVAIDHAFLKTKACLVLCGSNQGFMESEVLGAKSPLYGRRTAQIHLHPLDYAEAAQMFPTLDAEESFKYYGCIGGVPYYLAQVRPELGFKKNVERLFFSPGGLLYEEPVMLLRQELREPALYNSILRAIGAGATRQHDISSRTGIDTSSVPKYLRTLVNLDLVERVVPFGEPLEGSRRGIYRIKEPCFAFWYAFVMPVAGDIEAGAGQLAAQAISERSISTYLGQRFEEVCRQWMRMQALEGALPIPATGFGSWWGANPATHQQDDIDVVAADRMGRQLLIGECEWRNAFNETETLEKLLGRAGLVRGYETVGFYLFSKNRLSPGTYGKIAQDPRLHAVALEELYAFGTEPAKV